MIRNLLFFFAISFSGQLAAQNLFFFDSSGRKPLDGVIVRDLESVFFRISDERGRVSLGNLPDGKDSLMLSAQLMGYKPLQMVLRGPQSKDLNIFLHAEGARLPEFVVASIRMEEKAAGTFTTIRREDIKRQDLGQDLPYLVQFTPSVQVNSDAGAGIGYTNLWIRGSDATRINVTLNGVPLNDSESQGLFWVNMPDLAASTDQIQIQRGVGTSTNGAASFGASMNISTLNAVDKAFTEAMVSYGSFNSSRIRLAASTGKMASGLDFQMRLSSVQSQGFIDRGASDLLGAFISSGYEKKTYSIRANALLGKEKTYQCWYGVPEAKLRNDKTSLAAFIERNQISGNDSVNLMNSNPRSYNFYSYENQIDNYSQNHYQLIQTFRPSRTFWINLTLHGTTGKGYFEEFKPGETLSDYGIAPVVSGADTLFKDDVIRQRWLDNYFLGAIASAEYRPNTNTRIIAGLSGNTYRGAHFGEAIETGFSGTLPDPSRYYSNDATKQEQSGFIKVDWQHNRLKLFGDLQFRMVQYSYQAFDADGAPVKVNTPTGFFNPKAGISYQFRPALQAYATYGRAGKEPVRDDYINSISGFAPVPEFLDDYETGVRFNSKRINAELNYFFMQYRNQLVLTGAVNDVGAFVRSNVPESYRQGIELAFAYLPVSNLRIIGNASWIESRAREVIYYLDDFGTGERVAEVHNNRLMAFSPSWNLSGMVLYQVNKRLELGYTWRYLSTVYLDNTQNDSKKLDPYSTSGATVQWNPAFMRNRLTCRAQINNLFNQEFETNGYTYSYLVNGIRTTENFYYPQAGINWLVSLAVKI